MAIEGRIGELLPTPEEARKLGGKRGGEITAGRQALPVHEGLHDQKAFQARTIARHPEAVEAIIKEAEEIDINQDDIEDLVSLRLGGQDTVVGP